MRVSPRTLIAAAAVSAAVVIAVPAPAFAEDDDLTVDAGLPITVPGAIDDSSDGVTWVTHIEAGPALEGGQKLTLDFGIDPWSKKSPIELNVDDDRCNPTDTGLVCDLPDGHSNEVQILLRDNWRSDDNGPVHVKATVGMDGKQATDSGDITIAPDERAGRVAFDAPSQVESDQTPAKGKGVDMPVTVKNNSSDTLGTVTLKLKHGKEEEQDGIILASDDKRCKGKVDLDCTIAGLVPGESTTIHVTVFANPDLKVFGEPETISGAITENSQLWGYHDDETSVVKAKGGGDDDVLPVTGSSLTLPLAGGAGAIALGAVLFVAARRRRVVED